MSFDTLPANSIGGVEFLALLGDEERRELEELGRRRSADRPEVLIARGDPADRVIVIEAGRVKISVPTSAGDAVLTFRGPGALLGEQALIDDLPRSANVIAVEPVELLVIAASAFRAYLNRRPNVALAMLAVLSARLRASDRRLAEFAAADTRAGISARLRGGGRGGRGPRPPPDHPGRAGGLDRLLAGVDGQGPALPALARLDLDPPPRDRGPRPDRLARPGTLGSTVFLLFVE